MNLDFGSFSLLGYLVSVCKITGAKVVRRLVLNTIKVGDSHSTKTYCLMSFLHVSHERIAFFWDNLE